MTMPVTQLSVGDSVLVSTIGHAKEDLVLLNSQGSPGSLVPTQPVYVVNTDADRAAFFPAPTADTFVWVIADKVLWAWSTAVSAWVPLNVGLMQITSPTTAQVLRYSGTQWVNATLALSDIASVTVATPATAQVLRYNGTQWVNTKLAAADLSDTNITSPTDKQLLQYDNPSGKWVNRSSIDIPVGSKFTVGGTPAATAFGSQTALAGDLHMATRVSGDSNNRLSIDSTGLMLWGSGSGAGDTNLYRSGAGVLATDNNLSLTGASKQVNIGSSGSTASFAANRALTTDIVHSGRVSGDTQNRIQIGADGKHSWGPGGSTAPDTTLYRNGVGLLTTDGTFSIQGITLAPTGAASGTILRHNGTSYVSVAEETVAQYPNVVSIGVAPPSPTVSTSAAAWVDVGGATFSFTKNKAGTKVRLFASCSCWFLSGNTGGGYIGVNINGVDYQVAGIPSGTAASSHLSMSGGVMVSGLAAGTYTVKGRAKSQNSGVMNLDSGDFFYLECTEVH
jgi:hypothetical protein